MSKKNAILSVYHKEGIIEFAQGLIDLDWRLYASGGTAKHLKSAGFEVTDVANLVGGGAILGHRVVTLSREVHAGLLARDIPEDIAELEKLGIPWFDLVCVDLYPLEQAIADPTNDLVKIVEMIDIGGPTMISSGSKGQRIVICDPADRKFVLKKLEADGDLSLVEREKLAAKADMVVANYRLMSARYRGQGLYGGIIGLLKRAHRYGENPHQKPSGLFSCNTDDPLALDKFQKIEGADPGYINDTDLDRLLITMTHLVATFRQNNRRFKYFAVGAKHGNACGASYGDNTVTVLRNMIRGNPRAIFGGMIITNFTIDSAEARVLRHSLTGKNKRILDGVFAPEVTPAAIAILKRPKGACKIMINPALADPELNLSSIIRPVRGGFLMQPNHSSYIFSFNNPAIEQIGRLTRNQKDNLLLAAAICQTSNSNTITIAKNRMLIGNGTTRPDRVDAANLAISTAQEQRHRIDNAVCCSDSFFPFPDGPKSLIRAGVKAILTVSGSVNDKLVKKTITKAGLTLVWLPVDKGRMFFGH